MNEMLIGPPPTTEQEKFVIIGYLLNIKDQVQQQCFQAISYSKLVTWQDLNIKLQGSSGGGSDDIIYAHSKEVALHNKISNFM